MGTSLNGLTPAGTYPGLIKTGDNAPIDGTLKTLSDGNGNNLPMSVSTTAVNFTNQLQQGGVAVPTASQVNAKQDTLVSGTNIKTINGTSVLGSGDIVTPYTPPSGVAGAIQFSNGSAFASDATNLFWDDTNNRLGVGTNAPTTALDLNGTLTSLLTLRNGATNFVTIGSAGGNNSLRVWNAANTATLDLFGTGQILNQTQLSFCINNLSTERLLIGATTAATIKGSGSTSATTSLLVQNSDGIQALKVADDGLVTVASLNSIGYLGVATTLYITSNSNIKANGSGIIQLGDAPETGFNRLQFGGTTSSFPSLKRNGTAIDVRLADDSNYASFNTGATFIKGSGSTSATASFLVQNSSGTTNLRVGDSGNVAMGDPTASGGIGAFEFYQFYRFFSSNSSVVGCYKSQQAFSVDGSRMCINVAGGSHSNSASFQVDSTTTGILPPRMTTTQKNAIASPASGLVVYDTTTNKLCCYNGSTWNDLF